MELNQHNYSQATAKYFSLEQSAKKRDIPFDLNMTWFADWWIKSPDACYYCGITIDQYYTLMFRLENLTSDDDHIRNYKWYLRVSGKGWSRLVRKLTVDRIDSFKGYEEENIVKCCWFCNKLKGKLIEGKNWKLIAKKVMAKIWKYTKKVHEQKLEELDEFIEETRF